MKNKLHIAVVSSIGVATIIFSTRTYGLGLSPDSVGYIQAARSMADNPGSFFIDGIFSVDQPPLYPAILAFIKKIFGVDPVSSAPFVNAFIFGTIIYLSGLLFQKFLSSSILAILGTFSLLVAIPLIETTLMAWSEPLFICLVVLFITNSIRYWERLEFRSIIFLSLSVAFACITRYIGVVLILLGVIYILISWLNKKKVIIWHLLIYIIISCLPIGVWLFRNLRFSGTLFGERDTSIFSLSESLLFAFDIVLNWFLPPRFSESSPLYVILSLIISIYLGYLLINKFKKEGLIKILKSNQIILLMIIFIVVYTGFLLISSASTAHDRINNRLMSPIILPFSLVFLILYEKLSEPLRVHLSLKFFNIYLIVCFAAWLFIPARVSIPRIIDQVYQGQGYSSRIWKESSTIDYILQPNIPNLNCSTYLSNAPDVLYIIADIPAIESPKKRHSTYSPQIADEFSTLRDSFHPDNNSCLIWFDNIDREYLFTPDELRTVVNMKQLIRLNDGTIYIFIKQ